MDKESVKEVITKVRAGSKKRNFVQSFDLAIGLRDINLKDPSKRFRAEILLPHPLTKPVNLCIIGDADIVSRAKEANVKYTLTEDEMTNLARDAKEAKSFIDNVDYFLAIPQLMAAVGKNLGRYLGPVGKMPSVLPPGVDIAGFIGRYSRIVRIRLRQNPVIQARVATEDMSDDDVADNVLAVINDVSHKLDNGMFNIKSINLKLTMGPSFELK